MINYRLIALYALNKLMIFQKYNYLSNVNAAIYIAKYATKVFMSILLITRSV